MEVMLVYFRFKYLEGLVVFVLAFLGFLSCYLVYWRIYLGGYRYRLDEDSYMEENLGFY